MTNFYDAKTGLEMMEAIQRVTRLQYIIEAVRKMPAQEYAVHEFKLESAKNQEAALSWYEGRLSVADKALATLNKNAQEMSLVGFI